MMIRYIDCDNKECDPVILNVVFDCSSKGSPYPKAMATLMVN